jgi:hypothetical protein
MGLLGLGRGCGRVWSRGLRRARATGLRLLGIAETALHCAEAERHGVAQPVPASVGRPQTLPTAPRDHARYRYLLNIDGLAGSTRMGVLMATDSVILKSR